MDLDIRGFGAVPDGKTLCTAAIQSAVDRCTAAGGGRVIVAGGRYLFGTIELKDNVDLHLEADGVLFASPRCEDFPETPKKHVTPPLCPRYQSAGMIVAEECANISLTGKGTIDCNGTAFIEKVPEGEHYWMPYRRIGPDTPPRVVFFAGCRNVLIEDVTMINQPAGWSYWIHDCDYVTIDRIKVLADVDYPNNDGVHINCSRNVSLSNSTIVCGDDSVIVRANNVSLDPSENKVCERVTVSNCTLTSHSSGIRIGWICDGVIRNCVFSNLVITDTRVGIGFSLPPRNGPERTSDEGREETLIENLSFHNIVMDRVYTTPIRMNIADCPNTRVKAIRGVYFNGVHARACRLPELAGREDCPIENVSFTDCTFERCPVGEFPPAACAPEKTDETASVTLSHISNLRMENTSFTVR